MLEGKAVKDQESLLTVFQLSQRLNISQGWIYSAVEYGIRRDGRRTKLPHFRCGSRLRFRLSTVLEFLEDDGDGGS